MKSFNSEDSIEQAICNRLSSEHDGWARIREKQEGIEPVSGTHGFKIEAPDGKLRMADVLDSEGVALLAKHYPNNRANGFLDWFTYSDSSIDGQSKKKAYQLYESGLLKSLMPGSVKCLQQILLASSMLI